MSKGTLPEWAGPAIFGFLGTTFAIVGGLCAASSIALGMEAEEADGVVVENVIAPGSRKTLYRPVVEFMARDRMVKFTSGLSSNPASYDVGDRVKVLFRPERPEDAVIDSFLERYLTAAVFGGMGLIFAGAGYGWWRAMRK